MIVEGVYLYNIMMPAVPNYLRKPGRDIIKYDAPIKSNHLMDTTSDFAPWDLNKALSTPVKVSIVSCFWSPSSWTGIPLSVNVLKTNHIHKLAQEQFNRWLSGRTTCIVPGLSGMKAASTCSIQCPSTKCIYIRGSYSCQTTALCAASIWNRCEKKTHEQQTKPITSAKDVAEMVIVFCVSLIVPEDLMFAIKSGEHVYQESSFLCHPCRSWEFHDGIKYQCPGVTVPKCRRFWAALTSLLTHSVVPPKKKETHVIKTVIKRPVEKNILNSTQDESTYSCQDDIESPNIIWRLTPGLSECPEPVWGCQPKVYHTEFAIITWNPKK